MRDQKRILVVEDEPHQAANTVLRLQNMGYHVLGPVDSGEEAEHMAQAERPDLVLMDIVLRGPMDGIDAARRIARFSIPVIYLTSHVNLEILERAKLTEPLGFVVKPFTDREILATVTMAIYRSEVEHELAEFKAIIDQSRHDNDTELAMLLRLLNNLPGIAYRRVQEPQASFEYLSAGAQRLTGYTLDQLKNGEIDFYSLIEAQDREGVLAAHAKARSGDQYSVEYRLIDADEHSHCVRETGCGILDRNGVFMAIEAYISSVD